MQMRICKQFDFHRITKQKLRFPIKTGSKKLRFPIKFTLKKLRFPINLQTNIQETTSFQIHLKKKSYFCPRKQPPKP